MNMPGGFNIHLARHFVCHLTATTLHHSDDRLHAKENKIKKSKERKKISPGFKEF